MDARVTPLGGEHTFSSHSPSKTQSAHKRTHQSRTDKLEEKKEKKTACTHNARRLFCLFVLFVYFLSVKKSCQGFINAQPTDSSAKECKITQNIGNIHWQGHCLFILARMPVL